MREEAAAAARGFDRTDITSRRRTGYVRIGTVRVRVREAVNDGGGNGDGDGDGDGGCCYGSGDGEKSDSAVESGSSGSGGGSVCTSRGGSWSCVGLPVSVSVAKNRAASCFRSSGRKGVARSSTAALDRFSRLGVGGPPQSASVTAPGPPPPRKRSSSSRQEKTERLKELTEKLKKETTTNSSSSSSSYSDPFEFNLELPKVESRAIVGAYIQRTIPFRSASFSQVDYSTTDGKYNVRPARSQTIKNVGLSRQKKVDEVEKWSSNREIVDELNGCCRETVDCLTTVRQTTSQSCPTSPEQLLPRIHPISPPPRSGHHPRKQLSSSIEEESPVDEENKSVVVSTTSESGSTGEERPKLTYQSSEEREDESIRLGRTVTKQVVLSRTNSLSEGDSDNGGYGRGTPSRGSPSLFDLSDSESKLSSINNNFHPPRSYSKRPLRGPYGQMLEAEMKKPDARKFVVQREELKFLSAVVGQRPERTTDDAQLGRRTTSPKRKTSSNVVVDNSDDKTEQLEVRHQRTTSSPSQLEGCSSRSGTDGGRSSHQLLAHLLKGSSERALTESDPAPLLINSPIFWKDTRTHVVIELYETEKSYVESLQILVMKYLQPLKNPDTTCLTDASVVDDIFHKVPDILAHHELFLSELRKRLENWDINQKIGDVLLDTFTKPTVIDTYSAFINNWETAYETIKTSMQSKPAFARFVETTAKEHKGKLSLDSLLIMPVQRIPRYELLIQTLLKHTDATHSDVTLLLEAQQGIHELATTINLGQHPTLNTRSSTCHELAQLESIIEGLAGGLTSTDRTFLCHDQVSITTAMGRKDRALFLFSDLLIIASIKRRSGTIRKIPQNVPGSLMHALEGNRFKLLMKIPLDDLEIVKDDNVRKMLKEMEQLNADVSTLSQMAELVTTLHCPHSQLEENVREMLSALNNQLSERHTADSQLSYLELNINTPSGLESVALIFSKPEKRTLWEETFNDAKQRLAISGHQRALPELMSAVPIRKTRAGLQFTCAAATHGPGLRDVWVCNSDGYVGQVCVLSLHPEPTVTSCNGVCNARILCIAPVPGPSSEPQSQVVNSGISISVEDADKTASNIHLDSSSSSSDDDDREEDVPAEPCEETSCGTMWLGTEDGCIHVYNCTDNIRTKKNKIKIQHNAPVHSIIYLDNRVYIALANGDLSVYSREQSGSWNTNDAISITVGTAAAPVTRIMPIANQLWCTCRTSVRVLNTVTLEIENSFTVCDSNRAITSMANSGYSVWIALQNSSSVRLFNAATFSPVGEVSIAPAVTKMLASSDDIIRQHKSACLRVTSLLACKDLLWIGTSAGVILTMQLPHVLPTTTKMNSPPNVAGVPHGHTGHVRFLTTVDMSQSNVDPKKKAGVHAKRKLPKLLVISGGDGYEDFRSAGVTEMAGREDSTNHLLLWHV